MDTRHPHLPPLAGLWVYGHTRSRGCERRGAPLSPAGYERSACQAEPGGIWGWERTSEKQSRAVIRLSECRSESIVPYVPPIPFISSPLFRSRPRPVPAGSISCFPDRPLVDSGHPCQVTARSAWRIGSVRCVRLIDRVLRPAMLGVGVTATRCIRQSRKWNLQIVVVLRYEQIPSRVMA